MFSVYPENQSSVPTRRNSMGKFSVNLVLTPHRMPGSRSFVYATKVLSLPDQLVMDGKQGKFEAIRHARFVEYIAQMMLHRLLGD